MAAPSMTANSTIARARSVEVLPAQMCPRCEKAMIEEIRELELRKSARPSSSIRLPFWVCDSCGTKRPRLQD